MILRVKTFSRERVSPFDIKFCFPAISNTPPSVTYKKVHNRGQYMKNFLKNVNPSTSFFQVRFILYNFAVKINI